MFTLVRTYCRSCHSRAKSQEKNRLIHITVLCPIPHRRTSQTVSRNSSNFTVALHRQENPQQQSQTHHASSPNHHTVMNVHTQEQEYCTALQRRKKPGVGPQFSTSEYLRHEISIAKTSRFLICFHKQRNQ